MPNSFYTRIKESFTDLLINMRQAEAEMLTAEEKIQIQRWYTENLQGQVQRLTHDAPRVA